MDIDADLADLPDLAYCPEDFDDDDDDGQCFMPTPAPNHCDTADSTASSQPPYLAHLIALTNALFSTTSVNKDLGQLPNSEDIADDRDSERESIRQDEHLSSNNVEGLFSSLRGVSKGVLDSTYVEYERYFNKFFDFCKSEYGIPPEKLKCRHPLKQTPELLSKWIHGECDTVNLDHTPRDPNIARKSFTVAQKMRAAVGKYYAHEHGWGDTAWHQDQDGNWCGNPSVNDQVSCYMLSLHRRKVRAGEGPMQSRAVTEQIYDLWYVFNHSFRNAHLWEMKPFTGSVARGAKDPDNWAGGRERRMHYAGFVISFLCLLRSNELQQLEWEHVSFPSLERVCIVLPFRKTHQYGDIRPFELHKLHESEKHLCPVRAFRDLIEVYIEQNEPRQGYVFRKFDAHDRIVKGPKHLTMMSSDRFCDALRHSLIDVGIDPFPYGTHSFRRGGTQYLANKKRWLLHKICDWGGWSDDFTHLTIVKYLISWNDAPTMKREDFWNPNLAPLVKCHACGRSCPCA